MAANKYAHRKTHQSIDVKYLEVPDTRPITLKHKLLAWAYDRPKVCNFMLGVLGVMLKVARLPGRTQWHPLTKPKNNVFYPLPTDVKIQSDSIPLPAEIAKGIIRRSKHIVMLDRCLCRDGRGCTKYNHEIACLFCGDSGIEVAPTFSHRISAEEACKHVDRAIAAGLVPTTARARVDNMFFLFPDKHAVVGMCFCCECCCLLPKYATSKIPTDTIRTLFPHLPGLEITVNENCAGCGACVKTCAANAIKIQNGRAFHADNCLGCGRCAQTCPHGAVELIASDPLYVRKVVDEFLSAANLDTLPENKKN